MRMLRPVCVRAPVRVLLIRNQDGKTFVVAS